MTMKKKPNAAEMLTRHINSTKPKPDPKITDEFSMQVARRLESRGITSVPGLPQDEAPQWYDIALEQHRRNVENRAEQEAQRQAEQVAALPTPDLIRSALTGTTRSNTMPLNGTRVLSAALAGGDGTINSHSRISVAGLIRQSLIESAQDGRSE